MNRRDFVGALLMGLAGTLLGCSRKTPPSPAMDPGAPPERPSATETAEPADEHREPQDADRAGSGGPSGPAADKQMVECPKCHAENELVLDAEGNPKEITCWKCGHKWTPTV